MAPLGRSAAAPGSRDGCSKPAASSISDFEWSGVPAAHGTEYGCPRHFHLLSDQDLEDLRPISQTVVQCRSEIVPDWYQKYVLHFGNSRSLSQGDFERVFENALQHMYTALLDGELDKFTAEVNKLGELLAERRMPLEEVIASLQLFKNSIRRAFPQDQNAMGRLAMAFDKLSHVQIILLVSAYFGSDASTAGERNAALEREAAHLPAAEKARFHGLVGSTISMRQLYQRIEAVAATRGNLLIVGESGTGKELVARAVHRCGARADRPFVALNCAALPKDLIESELFGYKRGAFSGAATEYLGLFRAADRGTLFLDDITEMSAQTQSKLLRAIQERAIRPVGSTREQSIDVRIIASTNRNPETAVADGHLRQDLYYRLQAALITVPPLRERPEDIGLLVEHFICMFNQNLGRSVRGIEHQALDALLEYEWPGNVRELSNVVEGAFTFGKSHLITLEDLPPTIAVSGDIGGKSPVSKAGALCANAPVATFAETEREIIARALQNNSGNKVRAAEQLKISRKKLYAKIAKYGLSPV
jgi:transcriptional regulator with PAS, ATPase and Fis domain